MLSLLPQPSTPTKLQIPLLGGTKASKPALMKFCTAPLESRARHPGGGAGGGYQEPRMHVLAQILSSGCFGDPGPLVWWLSAQTA